MTDSSRVVTVSACQFSCTADITQNMLTAEAIVRLAASNGANIVLLQELFLSLYFCQFEDESNYKLAIKNDSSSGVLKHFKALSKELQICLPISFFEVHNNNYYNTTVVYDSGVDLGYYRKSHIPTGPGYEEKFYFTPGDTGFRVFETKYCKIGIGICWDQWYVEVARILSLQGAELLLYPTAIGSEPHDSMVNSRVHWMNVMRGHSAANIIPVVCSNRIGTENGITFYGNSFITDHTGEIIKKFDVEQQCGVLTHTFNLDDIKQKRVSWGVFRDRRIDLYQPILTHDGRSSGSNNVNNIVTNTHELGDISVRLTTPVRDNFVMPAEYDPHEACWMAFPYKKSVWSHQAKPAQEAIIEIAKSISRYERVMLLVLPSFYELARKMIPVTCDIKLIPAEYDDIWLRDTGPTFVVNHEKNSVRGINWKFQGWGLGEKYIDIQVEDKVSYFINSTAHAESYICGLVLEGGSFHTDGEGTLLTTEECVLNSNRDENRTKESLTKMFQDYLGVEKVIYLPFGVIHDNDTNGHVDNMCTFVRPGEVILAFPDDVTHPQYARSQQAYEILSNVLDAKNRKLKVHILPHPPLMHTTADDLVELEDDLRSVGEPLAGSYINYYLANNAVILPQFGVNTDEKAVEVMKTVFPAHDIVPVNSKAILLGGGNIHCCTQQQPKIL